MQAKPQRKSTGCACDQTTKNFDVEPEERTEKWMQQLPDRVCKIYREIAERMKNKRYFLIKF